MKGANRPNHQMVDPHQRDIRKSIGATTNFTQIRSNATTSFGAPKSGSTKNTQKVSFPGYLEIPRDSEDYRYTLSFDAASAEVNWNDVTTFFDEYGFVVLRNVLSENDCENTLDTIWSTLESEVRGFDRTDAATWDQWHSPFGLPGRTPRFERQLLQNRQSESLYQLYQNVMNCSDPLISQDRWTLYRPNGSGAHSHNSAQSSWQTRSNVHLDLNPWRYKANDPETTAVLAGLTYSDASDFIRENNLVTENMGTVVQGLMNITDNLDEDGGFIIIPGFHKHFDSWMESLGSTMTSPDMGSYKFDGYPKAMALAQRVTMRAGSVVVWDQRCAHGSKHNNSEQVRVAQFFKATPASAMSKAQLTNRTKAVQKILAENDFMDHVTPVGRIVFGLNSLVR